MAWVSCGYFAIYIGDIERIAITAVPVQNTLNLPFDYTFTAEINSDGRVSIAGQNQNLFAVNLLFVVAWLVCRLSNKPHKKISLNHFANYLNLCIVVFALNTTGTRLAFIVFFVFLLFSFGF